jgi:hypothetical protein
MLILNASSANHRFIDVFIADDFIAYILLLLIDKQEAR